MYCPFGFRSAPFIFTSLMDLFAWICRTNYHLPNLAHFVDDFIYAAPQLEAERTYARFQLVASNFGIPFKQSKFIAPTPTIEYLGFIFDAPSMSISLPDDKRLHIRALLGSWLTVTPNQSFMKRSQHEAQALLGHLIHIVQILPDGNIFCDHLITFIRVWKPPSMADITSVMIWPPTSGGGTPSWGHGLASFFSLHG